VPKIVSTRDAAKELGVSVRTLQRWVADNKIPAPKTIYVGGQKFWNWKRIDLARARAIREQLKPGRPRKK
jgi:excisionase family DNA binding protein